MRYLVLVIIMSISLVSCSVNEPFYIFNSSSGDVIVEVNGISYEIERGGTRKIRGLHYEGGTITFSSGTERSYDKSLKALLTDWKSLRGTYICDGFFSAEFRIYILANESLELQACSDESSPLVLKPDNI